MNAREDEVLDFLIDRCGHGITIPESAAARRRMPIRRAPGAECTGFAGARRIPRMILFGRRASMRDCTERPAFGGWREVRTDAGCRPSRPPACCSTKARPRDVREPERRARRHAELVLVDGFRVHVGALAQRVVGHQRHLVPFRPMAAGCVVVAAVGERIGARERNGRRQRIARVDLEVVEAQRVQRAGQRRRGRFVEHRMRPQRADRQPVERVAAARAHHALAHGREVRPVVGRQRAAGRQPAAVELQVRGAEADRPVRIRHARAVCAVVREAAGRVAEPVQAAELPAGERRAVYFTALSM